MVVIDLDPVLILIPMLIIISILGSIFYLKRTKVNRTVSSSNNTAILDHYNVLMNINEDQKTNMNSQRMKITMLQKKVTELEGYEPEEEEKPIDLTQILPLAAKMGIKKEQLDLILQSDQAKKFIKKNMSTIQSVLPLLANFTANKSNTPSESTVSPSSA